MHPLCRTLGSMTNTNHWKGGSQTGLIQHRVSERAPACELALKNRPNHHHWESPKEKDECLQVVGTQSALAGVSEAIGTTDGVVDHRAGHQLSAVLQRGASVPAAVELGNRQQKLGHRLCSVQEHPDTTPLLMPLPFRVCRRTNYGYIATHSSRKTSNFLSWPYAGEDCIKAWR